MPKSLAKILKKDLSAKIARIFSFYLSLSMNDLVFFVQISIYARKVEGKDERTKKKIVHRDRTKRF